MPCHNPITAYRSRITNPSGRRSLVFNKNEGYDDLEVLVPCGQCIGCKLDRSLEWATRITHEASLHSKSSFVTLTYEDRHLPPNKSLRKKDVQDFMKRLRFFSDHPLRYYLCGEYGSEPYLLPNGKMTEGFMPHYHICLFGEDFSHDRIPYKTTPDGFQLWNSPSLSDRWGFGHCVIGDLTFETAAYTARYVTKKLTGPKAPDHYGLREPEFSLMSRRPGIGDDWLKKNVVDLENGLCWASNGLTKIPKFYQKKLNQKKLLKLKFKQKKEAAKKLKQPNPYVLDDVQKAKFNLKKKKDL